MRRIELHMSKVRNVELLGGHWALDRLLRTRLTRHCTATRHSLCDAVVYEVVDSWYGEGGDRLNDIRDRVLSDLLATMQVGGHQGKMKEMNRRRKQTLWKLGLQNYKPLSQLLNYVSKKASVRYCEAYVGQVRHSTIMEGPDFLSWHGQQQHWHGVKVRHSNQKCMANVVPDQEKESVRNDGF